MLDEVDPAGIQVEAADGRVGTDLATAIPDAVGGAELDEDVAGVGIDARRRRGVMETADVEDGGDPWFLAGIEVECIEGLFFGTILKEPDDELLLGPDVVRGAGFDVPGVEVTGVGAEEGESIADDDFCSGPGQFAPEFLAPSQAERAVREVGVETGPLRIAAECWPVAAEGWRLRVREWLREGCTSQAGQKGSHPGNEPRRLGGCARCSAWNRPMYGVQGHEAMWICT